MKSFNSAIFFLCFIFITTQVSVANQLDCKFTITGTSTRLENDFLYQHLTLKIKSNNNVCLKHREKIEVIFTSKINNINNNGNNIVDEYQIKFNHFSLENNILVASKKIDLNRIPSGTYILNIGLTSFGKEETLLFPIEKSQFKIETCMSRSFKNRSELSNIFYSNSKLNSKDNDPSLIKSKPSEHKISLGIFSGYYDTYSLADILGAGKVKAATNGDRVSGLEIKYIIYRNGHWAGFIGGVLANHSAASKQFRSTAISSMVGVEYKNIIPIIDLPFKLRFSEGVNYVTTIPTGEYNNVTSTNQGRSSRLLNFLGFGISIKISNFNANSVNNNECYVGPYLYHRSGVFGKVSIFNHVSGGSNFPTLKLECSL